MIPGPLSYRDFREMGPRPLTASSIGSFRFLLEREASRGDSVEWMNQSKRLRFYGFNFGMST